MNENIYLLLNKPKGFITTTSDEHGRPTVMDLLKSEEKIFPVGRLDENTSGLLILTSDGEFSNFLTHPSNHISKTYRLEIRGFLPKPVIKKFEKGLQLNDGMTPPRSRFAMTKPAIVKLIERSWNSEIFELTIFEGRNRQIRRMCGAVGLELLNLERVAIGNLRDEKLRVGKYRRLTDVEIAGLKSLVISE